MIDEVHIKDVALIHEATFAPSPALTVVTGETGTGKTALLNALKLIIGERADASLVREGSEELQVEGRFFMEGGEEDGLVATRRVSGQGRSRASVNGSLASLKELAQTVGQSVDLCGQHEHQRLLAPTYQRALLDEWGAETIEAPHAKYAECLKAAKAAKAELERLQQLEQASAVELDRARFALEQIEKANPQPGEYEELLQAMPKLENAEMLANEATVAQRSIAGGGGALEQLEAALGSLDRIAAVDPAIEPTRQVVREAFFSLEDLGRDLANYRDQVDFPREELERAQSRASELQGLMRGFGPRMEDVLQLREESAAKIREYEGRDELIAAAQTALDEAEASLAKAAAELAKARGKVIPRFIEEVQAQLSRLEMRGARLEAAVADLPREQWDSWGSQSFELMFAAGAQLKAQRLGKIASGGETSRVMLALKVVLGECDQVDTLVFDEIDAGVGGGTARALGAVLESLAKTHQVIAVTHLPQVAVYGNAHYVVSKTEGAVPETTLKRVEGEERVAEVARMLSGDTSQTSLAHAAELLAERG
jgi:DNA repair protein RecN (Recombination protein N)